MREIGPEGEMEQHLMLNYLRFRTFEEMEQEVVNDMEAKTGSKLMISKNFSKSVAGDAAPMDVDSVVRAVNGNLASLVKGKKGGGATAARPSLRATVTIVGRRATRRMIAGLSRSKEVRAEVQRRGATARRSACPSTFLRMTMRLVYLSHGHPDLGHAVKVLKRVVRYLVKVPLS